MTKLFLATVAASLVTLPSIASAQALPAPVIAIVDIQRAQTQCTACKTALTQLETQLNSIKSLQTSLETPLRTEAAALQAAAQALNGKAPDAALQARATAFEKKQGDAERQLAARQQTFQRNRAYVLQQINTKLEPAVASVLTKRGATIMLDTTQTIRSAPSLDVTADVIAALNASLPSISTTAPAQAAPTRR
jgi:Skp family chaperone for outer membrane proteins